MPKQKEPNDRKSRGGRTPAMILLIILISLCIINAEMIVGLARIIGESVHEEEEEDDDHYLLKDTVSDDNATFTVEVISQSSKKYPIDEVRVELRYIVNPNQGEYRVILFGMEDPHTLEDFAETVEIPFVYEQLYGNGSPREPARDLILTMTFLDNDDDRRLTVDDTIVFTTTENGTYYPTIMSQIEL
jgi:hypothetical protein